MNLNQATQLFQQNQTEEAEKLLRQLVASSPHDADALHLLGLCRSRLGDQEKAIEYLQKAIQRKTHPMYYYNFGKVLLQAGRPQDAIESLRMANRMAPTFADAWFVLGNAYKEMGKHDIAIQKYKKACKVQPGHASSLYNWANLLRESGANKKAIAKYEECITAKPEHYEAHNNLGVIFTLQDQDQQAVEHFDRALTVKPDYLDSRRNKVTSLHKMGDCEGALRELAEMNKYTPENKWIEWQRLGLQPVILNSLEDLTANRQRLLDQLKWGQKHRPELHYDFWKEHSPQPPFIGNYQGLPEKEIKHQFGQFWDQYFNQLRKQNPLTPTAQMRSRPWVGLVVTSGHEGVFLKCMRGIVEQINLEKIELLIVCQEAHGLRVLQNQIKRPGVRWVVLNKDLRKAAEELRGANIDLLHYWEVGTDFTNYFLPYLKCAPIQSATWGTPVTSGIPTMDYYVSCKLLETENGQEHYTEKLIALERLPTYYYRPTLEPVTKSLTDFELPEAGHIYLCLQNLRKVHPDMDVWFKQLLERDPEGHLVFIHDKQPTVTELLKTRLKKTVAQDKSRLHFVDRMEPADYFQLLRLATVILDSFHYTGGANTSYDCIACGKIYVTLPTEYHRGKYGAAALQQIGVTDSVAKDEQDYIDLCLSFAADEERRGEVENRILAESDKVFEDIKAVQELEEFFCKATSNWRIDNG